MSVVSEASDRKAMLNGCECETCNQSRKEELPRLMDENAKLQRENDKQAERIDELDDLVEAVRNDNKALLSKNRWQSDRITGLERQAELRKAAGRLKAAGRPKAIWRPADFPRRPFDAAAWTEVDLNTGRARNLADVRRIAALEAELAQRKKIANIHLWVDHWRTIKNDSLAAEVAELEQKLRTITFIADPETRAL